MKVHGPGQPPTPAVADAETANKAGKTESKTENKTDKVSGVPGDAGKSFAERVSGPRGPKSVSSASPIETAHRTGDVVVADLATDLQAGKLAPGAAIEKVLDRVVARQIGPEAPPAVREQIRAALRDALESDPLLAEKLRQLE